MQCHKNLSSHQAPSKFPVVLMAFMYICSPFPDPRGAWGRIDYSASDGGDEQGQVKERCSRTRRCTFSYRAGTTRHEGWEFKAGLGYI